jgi:hypothetical protein
MTPELQALVSLFRRHLYLPDSGPLFATLGTIGANRLPGRPVWLLLVGPPSSGKSQVLTSLTGLDYVHPVGVITEAGLISGSPRQEWSPDAKGGLLNQVGDFGILVAKDFGSILNMRPEARQAVLAAFREIYDGHWVRHLGNDGGRRFEWQGKLGLLGACTETIDRHHAVMSTMGERFTFYRMPAVDGEEQARRALTNADSDEPFEPILSGAVTQFFAGLDLAAARAPRTEAEARWLMSLARLVVTCRTATERDSYIRQIELAPEPEAPARLVLVLDRLRAGLSAIGLGSSDTWPLLREVAFDSLPVARHRILEALAAKPEGPRKRDELVGATKCSASATLRHLEDLAVYKVVETRKGGKGLPDEFQLSDWAREKLTAVGSVPDPAGGPPCQGVPEKSHALQVGSGGVPEISGGPGNPTVPEISQGLQTQQTPPPTSLSLEEENEGDISGKVPPPAGLREAS